MKRVSKRRFRAARAAGVTGLRPCPPVACPAADGEEARRGYLRFWFVVRTDNYGTPGRKVYAFGALSVRESFPTAYAPVGTFVYDGGRNLAPVTGAVATFAYDGAGFLGSGPVSHPAAAALRTPLPGETSSAAATYVYDATGWSAEEGGGDPR